MENYFGEELAARYDDTIGDWGDAAIVAETVELLVELAGDSAGARARCRDWSRGRRERRLGCARDLDQ